MIDKLSPWPAIAVGLLLPGILSIASDLSVDLIEANEARVHEKLAMVAADTNNTGLTATGGIIVTNQNYRSHTFTNNGVFAVSGGTLSCEILIVAAGGGGGGNIGGGGGGGGVLMVTNTVTGTVSIVIGSGGRGTTATGVSGGNSSFGTNTALGGGGGAGGATDGLNGGSGGGGSGWERIRGTGAAGQGHAGGIGDVDGSGFYYCGAGGGGATAVGGNGDNSAAIARGGGGGAGYTSTISGVARVYGSGGGGASLGYGTGHQGDVNYGKGGSGGGDGGVASQSAPVLKPTGATYYGGGGGGGNWSYAGANGATGFSGVVIVRYLSGALSAPSYVAVLTVSSNGITQTREAGSNVFLAKVGIGTNAPAEKLHVSGNAKVDGTLGASAILLGNETRTNWPAGGGGGAGTLSASNNLAELTNPSAARGNLGLGSAATCSTSNFLTPTGNGSQLTGITAAQVGALSPTGDGSRLTGIGAAQVGALATNGDGSHLTGITAGQVGALSATGGVVNGALTIGATNRVEALYVTGNVTVVGTNAVTALNLGGVVRTNWSGGDFQAVNGNLDMATNRIVNLANPSNETDAVNTRFLWTSLSNIPPMGNLSMGIYTNRP